MQTDLKAPADCTSMAEVREEVRKLDREIIAMLGKRLEYVRAAVRYKPDEESIRRPEHWDRFFAERAKWGKEEGYDPRVVESMYRTLYDYTIEVQLALHRAKAD